MADTTYLDHLMGLAMLNGMQEIAVRVTQYEFPGGVQQATRFQAIAKFRNATLPWCVSVQDSAGAAFLEALTAAGCAGTPEAQKPAPSPAPVPRVRTRTRIPT